MESISQVKAQLLELRENYTRRIDAIAIDTHHKNEPVEKDFAEQATQSENNEVLAALDGEAQAMISQIDAALSRIADNQYGICAKCGIPIPQERLHVAPFTVTCIKCAESASH